MNLNWKSLYFGTLNKQETLEAVKDKEWQRIRISMKGKELFEKYTILSTYVDSKTELYNLHLITEEEYKKVLIRSTNYVTALSRGGLIKSEDYHA